MKNDKTIRTDSARVFVANVDMSAVLSAKPAVPGTGDCYRELIDEVTFALPGVPSIKTGRTGFIYKIYTGNGWASIQPGINERVQFHE